LSPDKPRPRDLKSFEQQINPVMWPVYYRQMLERKFHASDLAVVLAAEKELDSLFKLILKQESGRPAHFPVPVGAVV